MGYLLLTSPLLGERKEERDRVESDVTRPGKLR